MANIPKDYPEHVGQRAYQKKRWVDFFIPRSTGNFFFWSIKNYHLCSENIEWICWAENDWASQISLRIHCWSGSAVGVAARGRGSGYWNAHLIGTRPLFGLPLKSRNSLYKYHPRLVSDIPSHNWFAVPGRSIEVSPLPWRHACLLSSNKTAKFSSAYLSGPSPRPRNVLPVPIYNFLVCHLDRYPNFPSRYCPHNC